MAAPPPSYDDATSYPTNYPPQGVPYPPQSVPYPPQAAPFQPPQSAPNSNQTAPYPQAPPFVAPQQAGVGVFPPYGATTYGQQQAAVPMMPPPPVRFNAAQAGALADPKEDSDSTEIMGDGWAGSSFNDKAIRRAFIRKVYLILTAQLLVTVAFIAFFLFHKPTQRWIQGPGFWCYGLSYATFLVTYITLVCCPSVRRKWPGNFICLAVFTLAFSYMTGTIASYYDTKIVLIAAGITALVTFSISLFAMQTKIDFTLCGGVLFAGSMVLFFFGISCIFVYAFWGPSYILQCVYGALAALLFSLFLAYDTQMLMGGRKFSLSPEEHIFGSLQLYLDIVYIFLIILSLFGKSN